MKNYTEQQDLKKQNFLCATSRRFYVRKKPSNDNNQNQVKIQKVIKALNMSHTMRNMKKFQHIKTQGNQQRQNFQPNQYFFNQIQFIKKQLRASIQINLKKLDKKWKNFINSYEDLKSCINKESVSTQENVFYKSFLELIKLNIAQNINKNNKENSLKKVQGSFQTKNQHKISKIQIQNIRLYKQIQMLRNQLGQKNSENYNQTDDFIRFESQQNSQNKNKNQKKQDYKQQIQKLTEQNRALRTKIFQLQNQNIKLQQTLVSVQDALKNLRQQKTDLSKKVADLKIQNQSVCSQLVQHQLQYQNSQLKIQRWRSTVLFQRQQIISLQSQLTSIKNQYKDLTRKYKLLLKRLNNLQSNNGTSSGNNFMRQFQLTNPKYYQSFNQQLQAFHKIRNLFMNKESQNNVDKSNAGFDKKNAALIQSNYKPYLSQKQSLNNSIGIKRLSREHYSFIKPNFYNFVQSYMDLHGIDENTVNQYTTTYYSSTDFIITIRAILDSKFNEFLSQDFIKVSSLSTFTYVWLSKYKIHRKQKKVIQIKGDIDGQTIPTFYINLMSQKLNYNWQIITFRQFLMQSLTLDQLYFYLMARHYILQGDFLDNISGIYQEIYYVSIGDTLLLFQKFINDINYRKKVEQYIKRFIIYIRKRVLIDMHLILRILLEYYQSKKHQQFVNLNSLTQLLSKQKSLALSFQNFLKIFQYNFNYLSLTEKISIYKKCFSCSKGKISLEVILTVLSEQGYLCNQVKKIFLNDPIMINKNSQKSQISEQMPLNCIQQIQKFDKFFNKFFTQTFQLEKAKIGLQNIQISFQNVKEFDQTKIFKRIQLIFEFCIRIVKKMFYSKKIGIQVVLSNLQEITQMLQRLNKITCQKKQIMQIMQQFKRDSAAKKILRFYRKKRNQMHRTFIFGLKDQIFQQDQKIEGLRLEFNSMIENLKQKFQPKDSGLEQDG